MSVSRVCAVLIFASLATAVFFFAVEKIIEARSLGDSSTPTSSGRTNRRSAESTNTVADHFALPLSANVCESLPGGPVEVQGTGGSAAQPTGYPTLAAAFSAINSGDHTGDIDIDICGDSLAEPGGAILNASGSGAASYTSIDIIPVGGAARTISGAAVSGTPLITLNGADNVKIDGQNTSGNSLTIANTTVSSASGTSTIRFVLDATNNTITNTSVLGSSTMSTGTNGGNIWFSTASSGGTGNDDNVITNNSVGPAGTNLPTKGVYSSGTTTTAVNYNSGNTVSGNNIFDVFGAANSSAGIYLSGGTTDWTISNNRVYQTATRTQTTGTIHAGIQIASSNVNNCSIAGNIIGFANAGGTGTYDFVGSGSGSRFYPIYLSAHGNVTPTNIQGNTITNIAVSGPVSGTGSSASFAGILVSSGLANIGNVTANTIGSSTSLGAIALNGTSASSAELYGIYYTVMQDVTISNNVIGGIAAASVGALDVYGIRAQTSSTRTNTIQNNTVGFAAAPINNNSTDSNSQTYGIDSQNGTSIVTGNTVSNITSAAGSSLTGASATMIGIWIDSPSTPVGNNVSQNTVRNLSNTDATTNDSVQGLLYNGDINGTHIVARNLIHSISVPNATVGTINGIFVLNGSATFRNNMIALGHSLTNGSAITGIYEFGGSNNFFHNSIYIGGSGVFGNAATIALNSGTATVTRSYRDNIFFNARSNGTGTGKHYALQLGGTGTNPTGLTTNNNVIFANGTGGIVGRYGGSDRLSLGDWQTATGQDANSFSNDPKFIAPASLSPNLHIDAASPTVVEAAGADVGVTDDFDGQTRATLTPVDIGADAGNFTAAISDTTSPETTIDTNPALFTNDTTGDFTFSSNEAGSTFECSVDSGPFVACTNPFSTAVLADGSHTFQVRAIDPSSNVDPTPASYAWTIDTNAPNTSFSSTPNDPTNDLTGDFAFNSSESGSTFQCSLDGGPYASCTSPHTTATLVEGAHTFDVRAIDAAGNIDPTPATFTWNVALLHGSLQFALAASFGSEGSGTIAISVTRTGGTDGAVSANYSFGGGSATGGAGCGGMPGPADYVNTGGTVNFANGDSAPKTINVTVCDDGVFEGDQTFDVTLSGPSGGASIGSPNPTTITIQDNESAPTFGIIDVTVPEGDSGITAFTFTVTASVPSETAITIDHHTINGTATSPSDYTAIVAGQVTLPTLATTTNIVVSVIGDTAFEPNETFTVRLDSVSAGVIADSDGLGTIANDDPQPSYGGTIGVGTNQAITSLTNPGGLFQMLNAGTLSGNLTVNISTDLTAETGAIALNELTETGIGGYSVVLQASGGPRLISGSDNTALIELNGADRITFSGVASGPHGLTLRNTGFGPTIRLINDASNNSIIGCAIEGVDVLGTGVLRIDAGAITGSDNNTITDNIVRDRSDAPGVPNFLIVNFGTPTVRNSNTVIANNQLFNFAITGIFSSETENSNIAGNTIFQQSSRTGNLTGIDFFSNFGTNLISNNVIHDFSTSSGFTGIDIGSSGTNTVSQNRVYNINALGAGSAVTGIRLDGSDAAGAVSVVNNMISIVPSSAGSPDIVGIRDLRSAGGLAVSFNTILVGGTSAGADSWAFQRTSGRNTNLTVIDNIFFNGRTGSGNHFAVGDQSNGLGAWSSDFNILIGTGATPSAFMDIGSPVDIAAWKAGPPSKDANSITSIAGSGPYNIANMFASASDLHLNVVGNNPAINSGADIGVSTDFDGQTRPFNGDPDIGADEVQTVATAAGVSLGGRVVTTSGRGIANAYVFVSGGDMTSPRVARTGAFGYFLFEGLEAGRTYVIAVESKRYKFAEPVRYLSLDAEFTGLDFVANR